MWLQSTVKENALSLTPDFSLSVIAVSPLIIVPLSIVRNKLIGWSAEGLEILLRIRGSRTAMWVWKCVPL